MKTERFQEENISDSFSNDEEIKINKSQLNQNLFNTERAIWDIKSKIFLISAWKIIKNKIEDDYNIENKLQNSIKITKEMEYYARIYEIEHLLKSNNETSDYESISRILDSIALDLNIKSNLEKQLKFYWWGIKLNN